MSAPSYFVTSTLGRWSSHPYWSYWRRKWFMRIAFVPVTLVIMGGVWAARSATRWLDILLYAPTWLAVLGGTLAFAMAVLMTTGLCARITEWQSSQGSSRMGESTNFPINPWVFLLALALAVVGPFYLSQLPVLAPPIRFAFQYFALFPLVGLLLATRVMDDPEHPENVKEQLYKIRRRPIWLGLLLLVLVIKGLTLLHDIGQAVGKNSWVQFAELWIPRYGRFKQPFLGTAALTPVAYALFVAWYLWPALVKVNPNENEPAEGEAKPKKGLVRRFADWLLGHAEEQEAAEGAPTPPHWLNELLATLGEEIEPKLLEIAEDDSSPPSANSELFPLFMVSAPTEDQVRVLDRFAKLYNEAIAPAATDPADEVCPDLLIHGDPGSGRTTSLLACAAYAALVRGQRVLFIVPDALRQEAVGIRIKDFLRSLRLNYYISVAPLTDVSIDEWVSGQSPIPHIIVATVGAVEKYFYGTPSAADIDQIRRLIVLPEVLIVDDFIDFDDAQRSHLPFMIDKHRLLLAAESMPMQVVVACRRLAGLGEELLAKRLFTVKHVDRAQNVCPLKPPRGARAWRVQLESNAVGQTVEELVTWCLRRDLDVVLYREGIDEQQRAEQQAALSVKGRAGRLAVLSDLERPPIEPPPVHVDAIFYHEAMNQDVCLALRMHAGNDNTVIFSVAPRGAMKQPVQGVIPIVADRTAGPLLVAHLDSIARHLSANVPVAASSWAKFGVEYRSLPALARGALVAEPWFDLDHWEEEDYRLDLWPYVTLAQTYDRREPVYVADLPDPQRGIYRVDGVDRMAFTRPPTMRTGASSKVGPWPEQLSRRAVWFDHQNQQDLGEIDLAHACAYKLVTGRRSIGLRTIERSQRGQIQLLTDIWHGDGTDRYLPVLDLSFEVPAAHATQFWGSTADGMRWFELTPKTEMIVHARIVAHMSDAGDASEIQAVEFTFPAQLSALVLSPIPVDPDRMSEAICAALAGKWSTNDDDRFSSPLTGGFNYAIRTRVPGLHFYSRLVAFRGSAIENTVGGSIVWFVEPTSSGRTASHLFPNLLRRADERTRMLESAEWFLTMMNRTNEGHGRFIRRMTRIGTSNDASKSPIDPCLQILRHARAAID